MAPLILNIGIRGEVSCLTSPPGRADGGGSSAGLDALEKKKCAANRVSDLSARSLATTVTELTLVDNCGNNVNTSSRNIEECSQHMGSRASYEI